MTEVIFYWSACTGARFGGQGLITVVVPSIGKPDRLRACLEALRRQTLDSQSYEVLVVDGAPTPETREILLRSLDASPNVRFRIVRAASPAAIYNEGIREARGEIVAFCGDNVIPGTDWLERIALHFRAGFSGYIHGPIEGDSDTGVFTDSQDSADDFVVGNFAIEKAIFGQVGLFDTGFRSIRPMASDFYYRLRDARVPFTFEPRLSVVRSIGYRSFRAFREQRRSTECMARLARKHPKHAPLRQHLPLIVEAAFTVGVLLVSAVVITFVLNTTPLLGVLLSPAPFAVRDLWRIFGIARSMAKRGMRLTFDDCRRYVMSNWATAIAQAYYLVRGWLRFRFQGVDLTKPRGAPELS